MSARRSKYGAIKTVVDGVTFDSRAESAKYAELRLLERAGEIGGLTLQPKFRIIVDGRPVHGLPDKRGRKGRALEYRADFAFFEGGKRRVIDVKGMDTPVSRLKRALVQHIYNVEIEVVK